MSLSGPLRRLSRLLARLADELGEAPQPRVVLVLGGARSGKSHHAEALVGELGGDRVSYIATAQALDGEMEERIARHRSDRNARWQTLEAPLQAAEALSRAEHPTVLLDCLTLLSTNWLLAEDEEAAHRQVAELLQVARDRPGTLVVVSNEVGQGIVPDNALARRFRDLQGRVNRQVAEAADQVLLVVSGQVLPLKGR